MAMRLEIEIRREAGGWPAEATLRSLAETAVKAALDAGARLSIERAEIGLVLTDDARIRVLNRDYRGLDRPTNVLAFPLSEPDRPAEAAILGDIVLAFQTVKDEAKRLGLPFRHHMTHLIVHGFLHLIGYDHETNQQAEVMERLETASLAALGISDPYGGEKAAAPDRRV